MTNQEKMCKLPPEEFYDKMWWLYHDYGKQFTNTRLAVIAWLQEKVEDIE